MYMGQELTFVHIDTNFLAYGAKGEAMNSYMKTYFKYYKWTDDIIL